MDNIEIFIIVFISQLILKGIYSFFINLFGGLPERIHDTNLENLKALRAHELQVDSFYRDISSNKVSTLFEKWYIFAFEGPKLLSKFKDDIKGDRSLMINIRNNFPNKDDEGIDYYANKHLEEYINKLINDTIAYGSYETIRRLAIFQNLNYINEEIKTQKGLTTDKQKETEDNTFVLMFIVSFVLSSLKNDFTGEELDPLDIMKIKLKDFHKYNMDQYYTKAKQILKLN